MLDFLSAGYEGYNQFASLRAEQNNLEKSKALNEYTAKFTLDREFLQNEIGVETITNLGELLKDYTKISSRKEADVKWIASCEARDRQEQTYKNIKDGALGIGILIGGNLLATYMRASKIGYIFPTIIGLSCVGAAYGDEYYIHTDSNIERVRKIISNLESDMKVCNDKLITARANMEDIQNKLIAKIKECQGKIGQLKTPEDKAPIEALCKKAEIEKRKVKLILNDFALSQLQGTAPQFA